MLMMMMMMMMMNMMIEYRGTGMLLQRPGVVSADQGTRRKQDAPRCLPCRVQPLCADFDECEYFSYWPRSYNCFFATVGATQKAKPNAIDGPSNCTDSFLSVATSDMFV